MEEKPTFQVNSKENKPLYFANLLQRYRDQEPGAQDDLFLALYPEMKAECKGLFPHSVDDAEDATQETMIRIFKSLDSVQEPKAFYGWCKKVCRNTCLNMLEKANRTTANEQLLSQTRSTAGDERLHSEHSAPPDALLTPQNLRQQEDGMAERMENMLPGTALEHEEIQALIRDILESLPPQCQPVFALVLQGYSDSRIAEELDLPLGTVKSQRRKAMAEVKREARRLEREKNVAFRGMGKTGFVPILAILITVILAMTVALGIQYFSHRNPAQVRQNTETTEEAPKRTPKDETTTAAAENRADRETETPGPDSGGVLPDNVDRGGTANPNATPNAGGGTGGNGANNGANNNQPVQTIPGQQYIRPDGRLTAVSESSDWSDIVATPMETISSALNALGPALTDEYRKPYIATAKTEFQDGVLKAESVLVNLTDQTLLVTSFDDYVVRLRNGAEVARGSFVFDTPIRVEPNGSVGISLYFPEGYYNKERATSLQDSYVQGINDVAAFLDNSTRIHYKTVT